MGAIIRPRAFVVVPGPDWPGGEGDIVAEGAELRGGRVIGIVGGTLQTFGSLELLLLHYPGARITFVDELRLR